MPSTHTVDAQKVNTLRTIRTNSDELSVKVEPLGHVLLNGSHIHGGPKGNDEKQRDHLGDLVRHCWPVGARQLPVVDVVQLKHLPKRLAATLWGLSTLSDGRCKDCHNDTSV